MGTSRTGSRSTTAVAWLLFCTVMIVPYVHWLDQLGPSKPLDAYTVFPLIGVWAWSLMWTHYMHGTLTMVSGSFVRSHIYQRMTGHLVLWLILAHPGLLLAGLLIDTGPLAPQTALIYGGLGHEAFVVLGPIALLAFLSYELRDRLSLRERLGRHWRWVGLAQTAAMTLVFVHALGVGRHLQEPTWFRHYWVALGALLIPCFAVIGRADWRRPAGG